MKVEVKSIGLKKPNKWNEVRVMRHVSKNGDKEIIVLTNGKHEGDENGTFEGTVLYNSDERSIHKVGDSEKEWMKISFKEVEQLTLTFVS